MAYDDNNIFAKILRGEVPNKTVMENDHVLAFHDIAPRAPVHILVIPKGRYVDMNDLSQNASAEEIEALFRAVGEIARMHNFDQDGYRVVNNCGTHGGQDVPHFHLHILGGHKVGPLVSKAS